MSFIRTQNHPNAHYKIENDKTNKSKFVPFIQAENTYILALDGDVDFQPEALQLLIDRMKINPKVGATCGRIKPGGSGK